MRQATAETLAADLAGAKFVILDFSSPGCTPCKRIPAQIEELLTQLGDLPIKAYEIDIVAQPDIARHYFVLGVPTLILFCEGREIARFNSVPKKEKWLSLLR